MDIIDVHDLSDEEAKLVVAVSPQILLEFFAVITSPKRVQNPRTKEEAIEEVEKYAQSKHIRKIYPEPDILRDHFTKFTEVEVLTP